MLNSVDDMIDRETKRVKLERMSHSSMAFTPPEEICFIFGELVNNKSCGLDSIPSEIFINAPAPIYNWLSNLADMMLSHCYVLCTITNVKKMLVLNNNTLNPGDRNHYRLIAYS